MDNFFENIDRINEIITNGLPVETVRFEDSVAGQQLAELQALREELEKQRKELEKQRADQAAEQAAAKHREKIAKIRGFFLGIVGSAIAGLIVEYWPVILSFFHSFTSYLFEKLF